MVRQLHQVELEELIEAARDAIRIRNWDGVVVYWNKGAEDLYGWSRGEALGKIVHELLKTEFPIGRSKIENTVRRDGLWEGELTHISKDGRQVLTLSRWSRKRTRSDHPEILEINTDVTLRKQYERKVDEVNRVMMGNEEEILKLRKVLADNNIPAS